LQTLVAEAADGKIRSLIILGGNPVYDAPADIDVAAALDQMDARCI
jgi:anaerobic selenocysteine-containing dehydrogenase